MRAAMTAEEAAWVREHVWTPVMREQFERLPGFYLVCACESHWGPCSGRLPQHDTCHIGVPLIRYETIIHWGGEYGQAAFAEPYRHPTADATGWKYSRSAMVWLADRRCAWWCECACSHTYEAAHAPERNPARPIHYELMQLPGLELLSGGVR